jgi:hypothetical protein
MKLAPFSIDHDGTVVKAVAYLYKQIELLHYDILVNSSINFRLDEKSAIEKFLAADLPSKLPKPPSPLQVHNFNAEEYRRSNGYTDPGKLC